MINILCYVIWSLEPFDLCKAKDSGKKHTLLVLLQGGYAFVCVCLCVGKITPKCLSQFPLVEVWALTHHSLHFGADLEKNVFGTDFYECVKSAPLRASF